MSLMSALMITALAGLSFYGWFQMDLADKERKQHVQTLQSVGGIQKAFYRWVTAERAEQDAVSFTSHPTAAQMAVLANRYLPRQSMSSGGGTATGGPARWTVTGLRFGPVTSVGLEWPASLPSDEVSLSLTGTWKDEEIAAVQLALPYAEYDVATDSMNLPMRHPGSTAALANSIRRHSTAATEGMESALRFGDDALVTNNAECVDAGGLSVDAHGTPMACVDDATGTTRRWKPIVYSNVYCRDARLSPGDPNYTTNMLGAKPVIRVNLPTATTAGADTETMRATQGLCPDGWTKHATQDLCIR